MLIHAVLHVRMRTYYVISILPTHTPQHQIQVASNFFDKAHKLESLEMAQKSAVSPQSVPGKMLSCVGRSHLGDLGSMAFIVRIVVAAVPYDFLTGLFAFGAPYMGDYQKHNKNRGKQAAN